MDSNVFGFNIASYGLHPMKYWQCFVEHCCIVVILHKWIDGLVWPHLSWWRHQMETFSAILALLCAEFTGHGEFPAQSPRTVILLSQNGFVMVPTHSCMFVTYWDSIRVIRRVSQQFRTGILLIPVYSCSFMNVFLIYPSLFATHWGSFVCSSNVFMFVRVAIVLVRTDSCQFVPRSWCVLPVIKYEHLTNILKTSRMGWNHYKNAVRACRMNYECRTNSNHYTNKYEFLNRKIHSCPRYELSKILRTMYESVRTTSIEWESLSERIRMNTNVILADSRHFITHTVVKRTRVPAGSLVRLATVTHILEISSLVLRQYQHIEVEKKTRRQFQKSFSWMTIVVFWLGFYCNLFPMVQLTTCQHMFRWWLGFEQATSHYLNQREPSLLTHIHVTRSRGLDESLVPQCQWSNPEWYG